MLHLKNGIVFTMGPQGVLSHGDVLVENGKIVAVGENLPEQGGEVLDLAGAVVLPGLVDAHSHLGGFSSDGSLEDNLNEMSKPVTAEVNSYYGIDPNDKVFLGVAEHGITTSCVIPGSGNVVCGWGIAVKSAGESFAKRVIKNPVALKAAVGINPKGIYSQKFMNPMTRMGIAETLREYLRKVQEYMEKKAGPADKQPPYDEAMEHGIPVFEKKIPLKVHSYQHDMLTVLRIADEFDIDVTLDHAQGATDFLDEISSNPHVRGVVYGPIEMGVFPGELCKVDFDALKKLDDRGVCAAVMTDGPITNVQMIIDQVGEGVRAGMDPLRALRLITINPANIIGCADRIGSLEVGKDADIAVFSAQPGLDPAAKVLKTFIDGKLVYSK